MPLVAIERGVEVPAGCQWELSERNKLLKPSLYPNQITNQDLPQAPHSVRDLVHGVRQEFIDTTVDFSDGWHFTAVVGDNSKLAIIFSNIRGLQNTTRCPAPDFLKPEVLDQRIAMRDNNWVLPTDKINQLLTGTNLVAYNAYAAYNDFEIEVDEGLILKWPVKLIYFQKGVAYIHTNLRTIDSDVSFIDYEIDKRVEELEERLRPLRERRQFLSSLKVDSPISLFQPS